MTAEDMAGNKAEEMIEFSVNRCGSVYELSKRRGRNWDSISFQKPSRSHFMRQILITEVSPIFTAGGTENWSCSGARGLFCRDDGNEGFLETVLLYRSGGYFQKEGVYELLLTSKDSADNVSDTGIQKKQVAFVLD